jgi:hypothetical protein
MAIMSVRHSSFFIPNPAITLMQTISLVPVNIAISHFVIDPAILISQTPVYFCLSWMMFSKAAILS